MLNSNGALPELERAEVAEMLSKGVLSLSDLLNDLLSLARLEAGHEHRTVTRFDAAVLLRDFCTARGPRPPIADCSSKWTALARLPVEGDKPKVLRILQNLLLKAVKYSAGESRSVGGGRCRSRHRPRTRRDAVHGDCAGPARRYGRLGRSARGEHRPASRYGWCYDSDVRDGTRVAAAAANGATQVNSASKGAGPWSRRSFSSSSARSPRGDGKCQLTCGSCRRGRGGGSRTRIDPITCDRVRLSTVRSELVDDIDQGSLAR
jgi:hypothetical protein